MMTMCSLALGIIETANPPGVYCTKRILTTNHRKSGKGSKLNIVSDRPAIIGKDSRLTSNLFGGAA